MILTIEENIKYQSPGMISEWITNILSKKIPYIFGENHHWITNKQWEFAWKGYKMWNKGKFENCHLCLFKFTFL